MKQKQNNTKQNLRVLKFSVIFLRNWRKILIPLLLRRQCIEQLCCVRHVIGTLTNDWYQNISKKQALCTCFQRDQLHLHTASLNIPHKMLAAWLKHLLWLEVTFNDYLGQERYVKTGMLKTMPCSDVCLRRTCPLTPLRWDVSEAWSAVSPGSSQSPRPMGETCALPSGEQLLTISSFPVSASWSHLSENYKS